MQHQAAFLGRLFNVLASDADSIAHGVIGLGVGLDMPTLFAQVVEISGRKPELGVALCCATSYLVASFWWIG